MSDIEPDYEKCAQILRETFGSAPFSDEAAVQVLNDRGFDIELEDMDFVFEWPEIGPGLLLRGGLNAFADLFLAGRWFSRRVTEEERAADRLDIESDLIVPELMFERCRQWPLEPSGSVVLVADSPPGANEFSFGSLQLPHGTLDQLLGTQAEVVAVRIMDTGTWQIQAVPEPAPTGIGAALATMLEAESNRDPLEQAELVATAIAADDALFAVPGQPVSEELQAHGFAVFDERIGLPGFDLEQWTTDSPIDRMEMIHGIDRFEAAAILRVTDAIAEIDAIMADLISDHVGEDPAFTISEGLDPLAGLPGLIDTGVSDLLALNGSEPLTLTIESPAAVRALYAQAVLAGGLSPLAVTAFCASARRSGLPQSAGLSWLDGRAADAIGEVRGADQLYTEALQLDPGFGPAADGLARIASDRGEAERARTLLRRAGEFADDDLGAVLDKVPIAPKRDLPRNAPCWCGSGRKYKACHLRNESLPLEDRAEWLMDKVLLELTTEHRDLVLESASARAQYLEHELALLAMLNDELVQECALFEGGVLDLFVEDRGDLLPEDELITATQWSQIERSVYDTHRLEPRSGGRAVLTARDVRTGDVLRITLPEKYLGIPKGMLLSLRALPVGQEWRCFGGIEPVELHERDALIALLDADPDPEEIVEFHSRRLAPPQLRNMEQEELVDCEAEIRVSGSVDMAGLLDQTYERISDSTDDEQQWLENIVITGAPRVRANFTLVGDGLKLTANSEERFDRALAVLQDLDPGLTIESEQRTPMNFSEIREQAQAAGPSAAESVINPAEHPELAEELRRLMRSHEDAWLDESIPALNGITPREAAADPTRRDDLIRLLDTFPETGPDGLGMDPNRLRNLLGL